MNLIGELKNTVSNCDIGDYIKLGYIASTNVMGQFYDELETNNEIFKHATSGHSRLYEQWAYQSSDHLYGNSHVPNGYFYAICIGRLDKYKIFIPDRIIQNYISYNTVYNAGLISGNYKIETKKILGYGKIMDYDEIQNYLPLLKEISTDFRQDLDSPALGHGLGGGYSDSVFLSFNSTDGNWSGIDNLEMTSTISGNSVLYVADYEYKYNNDWLYIGTERGSRYCQVPRWLDKSYVDAYYGGSLVKCYTRSAIRPLLYLKDKANIIYTNDNNIYAIQKNI